MPYVIKPRTSIAHIPDVLKWSYWDSENSCWGSLKNAFVSDYQTCVQLVKDSPDMFTSGLTRDDIVILPKCVEEKRYRELCVIKVGDKFWTKTQKLHKFENAGVFNISRALAELQAVADAGFADSGEIIMLCEIADYKTGRNRN